MFTHYETERLILKVCRRQQAPLVTDFYKRNYDDFGLYEPLFPAAKTLQYHKSSLEYEYKQFSKNEFLRLYFFEKINPLKIIGTVSYRSIQYNSYHSCLIGYKMDKDYRQMGYAKEAIFRGNRIMFEELDLHRIEAHILPDNMPSMRLLESLGFTKEGLLRGKIKLSGEWKDHYLYAILAEDMYR